MEELARSDMQVSGELSFDGVSVKREIVIFAARIQNHEEEQVSREQQNAKV